MFFPKKFSNIMICYFCKDIFWRDMLFLQNLFSGIMICYFFQVVFWQDMFFIQSSFLHYYMLFFKEVFYHFDMLFLFSDGVIHYFCKEIFCHNICYVFKEVSNSAICYFGLDGLLMDWRWKLNRTESSPWQR